MPHRQSVDVGTARLTTKPKGTNLDFTAYIYTYHESHTLSILVPLIK